MNTDSFNLAQANIRPEKVAVVNQLQVPAATVALLQYPAVNDELQVMQARDDHWLDLTLTARPLNARASFNKHWQHNRFENIGRVFMVPAGESLSTRGQGLMPQTSIVCRIKPDFVDDWLPSKSLQAEATLAACLSINNPTVTELLRRLSKELASPGFASEALAEAMSMQLSIELGRYCLKQTPRAAVKAKGLSGTQLQTINERLLQLGAPPSLAELAELCHLSVRQLTRAYRQSTGATIGEAIAQIRIDNAITLLSQGMSVKATALTFGFKSSASFCCAFRKVTQQSPGQYCQPGNRG